MKLTARLFGKPYENVDIGRARQLIDDGAVLIDVRTAQEWQAGHAPEAVHVELRFVADRARQAAGGEHIMVVCRSGGRSSAAAKVLSGQGHTVFNVKGGIGAWERAGQRLVARGGGPGKVA